MVLLRVCALALAVTGCRQIIGADDPLPNDGRVPDTGSGSNGNACYTTIYGEICLAAPPNAPLDLSGSVPTGGSPPCLTVVSGATGDCVYAGTTITVASGTTVTITGTRPAIFIATGNITIDGTLDASSHGFTTAAGADTAACGAGTGGGTGAGGCGGSYAAKGGDGGAPNAYLAANALPPPTMLQGGCRGHSGSGGDGGNGGHSGGAIYLFSATAITISASGNVLANGAGGGQADGTMSGGGGGGSGGTIVLDAPAITVAGSACAGGGGGGGGATTTGSGQNGGDGSCTGGGSGNGAAGTDSGGMGAGSPSTAGGSGGDGVSGTSGGGGGGGGIGVIKVHGNANTTGATIWPTPS